MAATEHRLNCPAAVAPLPRKSQPAATTLPLYSRQRCRDGFGALFGVARVRAWRRGPAALLASLRFIWNATSGHRLRPWRSEYLKWRIETYSGMHAEELTARDMMDFIWREKWNLLRFLHWTDRMEGWKKQATGNRE